MALIFAAFNWRQEYDFNLTDFGIRGLFFLPYLIFLENRGQDTGGSLVPGMPSNFP